MAKVFLETGDTFTLSNSADVFGASGTGTETIAVTGAANVTVDANVERIDFSGNLADYTFELVGNQLTVKLGGAAAGVFTLDSDTIKMAFADGSADATLTGLGAGTLGGVAFPTSDAAMTGVTQDAADTSSNKNEGGSGSTDAGQSFTLSSGNDAIIGGTGNDTIDGSVAGTLNTGDTITDGSTTDSDTLTATVTGNSKPTVSNIETLNLDMQFGSIFDAAALSNATSVNVAASQSGVNSATLANTSNLYEIDPDGLTSLKLGGDAKVKLEGDTISISNNSDGGSSGDDITLNSTGSANTVTLGANFQTGTEVTVTGDQDITLKGLVSGQTVTDSQDANATSKALLGDVNAAFDASKMNVDQIEADQLTNDLDVKSGASVILTDGSTGDISTTDSSATLNLTSTDAAAGNVDIGTFKTVNYTVGAANQKITITATAGSTLETFNIAGSQTAEISFSTTADATPFSVNGVNATGNLTLKGIGNLLDTTPDESNAIQGGSGNDIFEIGAISATAGGAGFLGNGGDDIFKLTGNLFTAGSTGQDIAFLGGDGTDEVLIAGTAVVIDSAGANNNEVSFGVEQITLDGNITADVDASLTFGNDDVFNNQILNFVGEDNVVSNTLEVIVNAGNDVAGSDADIDLTDNTITHSGLDSFKLVGVTRTSSVKGSDAAETIHVSASTAATVGIDGNGGNDKIYGGDTDSADKDTIHGNDGNDTIIGGLGADILYGDAGNDVFAYQTADLGQTLSAAKTANYIDTIKDFEDGVDKIDLSSILGGSNGYTSVVVDQATSTGGRLEVEKVTTVLTGVAGDTAIDSEVGDNELLYSVSYDSGNDLTTLTLAMDVSAATGANYDFVALNIKLEGNIDINDDDFIFI
ncbi:MAG: beta strand repeat-containing protein [bacterium]